MPVSRLSFFLWRVLPLVVVALVAYGGGRLHHKIRAPEVRMYPRSDVLSLCNAQMEEKNKQILEAIAALQGQQNQLEMKLAERGAKTVFPQHQEPLPVPKNEQLDVLMKKIETNGKEVGKLRELVSSLASKQTQRISQKAEQEENIKMALKMALDTLHTILRDLSLVKYRVDILMQRIPARGDY